jgi:hypothetical protein
MNLKTVICFVFCIALLSPVYGCNGGNPAAKAKQAPHAAIPANKDEQLFRQFLVQFKTAVKHKNLDQLANMFVYPVQTNPQWSNDDLHTAPNSTAGGLMDKPELKKYLNDVFSADAIRLIPKSGDDALSEIDKTTTEDYYRQLAKRTDKGSTLYELNIQYQQDNGKETSFGFVFGRVGGSYKIMSYFRPWPLK